MEYFYGQIPIILCCSHNGKLKLDIPIRTKKNSILKNDQYTVSLSKKIIEKLYKTIGVRPYYIHNTIHRKYLDLNRECEIGTENKVSKKYWKEFHTVLGHLVEHCISKHKHCLLLDFHGNNQTENNIQLGYGISEKCILNYIDLDKSTLKGLNKFYDPFALIFTDRSLSSGFNEFTVFPNKLTNKLCKQIYFDGGYIIKTYSEKYNIDAIQIEISKNLRKENLEKLSREFTNAIILFYFINYYSIFLKTL